MYRRLCLAVLVIGVSALYPVDASANGRGAFKRCQCCCQAKSVGANRSYRSYSYKPSTTRTRSYGSRSSPGKITYGSMGARYGGQ